MRDNVKVKGTEKCDHLPCRMTWEHILMLTFGSINAVLFRIVKEIFNWEIKICTICIC